MFRGRFASTVEQHSMATVTLHVYDIANTDNENLNSFLKFVNNVSREVRAGGIYHGATHAFCHPRNTPVAHRKPH